MSNLRLGLGKSIRENQPMSDKIMGLQPNDLPGAANVKPRAALQYKKCSPTAVAESDVSDCFTTNHTRLPANHVSGRPMAVLLSLLPLFTISMPKLLFCSHLMF